MNRRILLRSVAPIASAFAGVCCAVALLSCTFGSDCDCRTPRSIVEGDFEDIAVAVPDGAPASLRDIDVTRLVIEAGTVVVHYKRGDDAGTATFTFGYFY